MIKPVLALALVSSLFGCVATVRGTSGPPPSEPPPAAPPPRVEHRNGPRIMEGSVRDAVTHQPIDRAAVDITAPGIREMTANTGPDGRYRTGEIPRGEFGVRCRREGYEVYQTHATMNDGIAHIDFDLVPKRR
jgi:hypothetical protein